MAKTNGLLKRLSDKNIVDGVRRQDEKVLNYLYDHYYPAIKHHVLQNSGSEDDVSDLFQDTIIEFYQKISDDDFHINSEVKGYFFGIARNLWSARLRQKLRVSELNIDVAEDDPFDLTDSMLEKILNSAFQKLKPDNQMVLTLYYEGMTYEEIALKMNLKDESYARRKKYLSKEALIELIKKDPEYPGIQRFLK